MREIDAALAVARASGRPATKLGCGNFPLPGLAGTFAKIAKEVDEGRGFFLVKGLPIERYSAQDAELLIAGVGSHFGNFITQNAFGDIIGHVRDIGAKLGQKDVRGYDTKSELRFHNDESDLISRSTCFARATTR